MQKNLMCAYHPLPAYHGRRCWLWENKLKDFIYRKDIQMRNIKHWICIQRFWTISSSRYWKYSSSWVNLLQIYCSMSRMVILNYSAKFKLKVSILVVTFLVFSKWFNVELNIVAKPKSLESCTKLKFRCFTKTIFTVCGHIFLLLHSVLVVVCLCVSDKYNRCHRTLKNKNLKGQKWQKIGLWTSQVGLGLGGWRKTDWALLFQK